MKISFGRKHPVQCDALYLRFYVVSSNRAGNDNEAAADNGNEGEIILNAR